MGAYLTLGRKFYITMRVISVIASIFLFAAAAIPLVAAAEKADEDKAVEQFCARIERVKKPTHLLQLLVELGVIEKPTWTEAEKVHRRSSGDLGITSTSFNVPKIDAVECVGLMSRSDDKDVDDKDDNPTITAITVQTKRELITYHLGDKGYFEKFRSGRQGPEPAEPPIEKITKPNKTSLLTPDPSQF